MKRGLAASFAVSMVLFTLFLFACPQFDSPFSFAIYDREGKLLGASVASDEQWRFKSDAVPDKVTYCLIEFEDQRFFLHAGVDPVSIVRALLQNTRNGRIVSGGSTLTMQTVRLVQKNPPRTVMQKLKEALLSLVLELRFSKKEILSLYASNAPYGGNVVGLEAASWRYYNRSSKNLTWAEAATLAVLPNQPALVHPGADRNRLLEKRNRLLNTMHKKGYFDSNMLTLSLAEKLPESPYPLPRLASHYLERQKKKGLPYTRIDRKIQIAVMSIVERASTQFSASGIYNAAAIVIDTRTGEILAYVGNTGSERSDAHNPNVDMIIAKRSSGSLLKPFLYAGLLDAGLLLSDQLVVDIPTRIGSYKPENNLPVYQGVVRASDALSRSLNVPAIRELREYGIAPFLLLLKKSGFTTFNRTADEYGLPLILGGGEITMEETVQAYASLMRRADSSAPVISPVSAVSAGAAYLTLHTLVNGSRPNDEALWQSFASAQKIAWKTGTSYGNRDAWAIGTTPLYTVGVWVGNASGEGRPELKSISTASPILFDIFSILPHSEWPQRNEMDLEKVTVCAASQYLAGPDCAETKESWKPRGAPSNNYCPYCRSVSLTPDGQYQATADDLTGKWKGDLPLIRKQFVLPPAIEYWYKKHSLSYSSLPPWIPSHSGDSAKNEMNIVFPENGARVFIPIEIDGKLGSLILEAAHRDAKETVFWDIDGEYLGETQKYHQMTCRPKPGKHILTITDTRGSRVSRSFEILKE